VAPNRCRLRVQRKGEPLTYEPTIELYQGIPKGKKLEQIIRSCTEAGVSRITPVHSRYSVPRIEAAAAEAKTRRRRKIAEEAVQQSGAAGVPDVALPIPLSEIPPAGAKLGLFFHQEPLADSSLHGYLYGTPTEISIVVGPEGGFSESEVAMLEQRGYQAVYLGPRVLRTETAALYAIAAIQVIQMEHEKWTRA
jgi:16S rRNA (uracil1498-N3)-methyltransferase